MKGRILTDKQIAAFAVYLKSEEKSENTVEKYIRDVRAFAAYVGNVEITKETVITYKNNLLSESYAARSINSMLASINGLLSFLGWTDLKVKSIKLQRQIYCPEEKELTKAEYMRLVHTAKQKGNERLNLLIQTICGTGIRVSELQYITVEAVRCGEAIVSLKGKTRSVFIVRELQKKLLRYAAEQKITMGSRRKKFYAQQLFGCRSNFRLFLGSNFFDCCRIEVYMHIKKHRFFITGKSNARCI